MLYLAKTLDSLSLVLKFKTNIPFFDFTFHTVPFERTSGSENLEELTRDFEFEKWIYQSWRPLAFRSLNLFPSLLFSPAGSSKELHFVRLVASS